MPRYSDFWLGYCAGALRLSPIWRDRPDPPLDFDADGDDLAHPAELIPIGTWCNRMSERERNMVVLEYARSRPRTLTGRRDRVEALAS